MRWTVPDSAAGIRLDRFLSAAMLDQSRSQLQLWIRGGHVRVNGIQVKTGYPLHSGDEITLGEVARPMDTLEPENIPLEILYEDDDLAVINKPAGMICHAGAGVRSGTLVNALLFRFGRFSAGDSARPGIVHRLDKSTSGLIIVAKNNFAHRALASQFKNREVRKEYITLVYGLPTPETGTINIPLGRDPKNRKKISVRSRRPRSAVTHYAVENHWPLLSLLTVRIETGRTHQIRVHLAQKGHAVVGDVLYGGSRSKNLPKHIQSAVEELNRLFLHAARLEFRHPRNQNPMVFVAPLPETLQTLLKSLSGGGS